jgi:uncharacterized protein
MEWCLALLAAFGIGVAKCGFAGVSLVHVIVFAFLFGAKESTGVVLPLLIVGDVLAVFGFHQHARWDYVWKMLPPTCVGVCIGWALMGYLEKQVYQPMIGGIIICLVLVQIVRIWRGDWFEHLPHSLWFAWSMGLLAGFTTMLANAAGPIMALYFLAIQLPKMEFVGTAAWFFLIINVIKVPFSIQLGLIDGSTLLFNLVIAPMIYVGLLSGRWLVKQIPQKLFDSLLLVFAAVAALKLLFW